MTLDDGKQLANTEKKLAQLEQWIVEAKSRPDTPENRESLRSLVQMANQLREEVARYRGHRRAAS